jgi:molybdate transport system substrate-binding protein
MATGVALLGLAACSLGGGPSPAGPSEPPVELTVFGAASLGPVLDRVAAAYAALPGGASLAISTDSSAALATQIEQGAPADVFLSADTTNPSRLAAAGLADGDPVAFATAGLAIIVPDDNPAGLREPFDVARPGVRVVAAGDAVPITAYAARLIENLAAEPGAPAGFVAAYAANVVSKEDNVAAVRAKIELGEGDAAIVYATDAAATDRVRTILVPATADVPASFAGLVVRGSPKLAAAGTFLAWLARPDGQAILAEFGYRPPGG